MKLLSGVKLFKNLNISAGVRRDIIKTTQTALPLSKVEASKEDAYLPSRGFELGIELGIDLLSIFY